MSLQFGLPKFTEDAITTQHPNTGDAVFRTHIELVKGNPQALAQSKEFFNKLMEWCDVSGAYDHYVKQLTKSVDYVPTKSGAIRKVTRYHTLSIEVSISHDATERVDYFRETFANGTPTVVRDPVELHVMLGKK